MKKLILILAAAFGSVASANAQKNVDSHGWSEIEYEGDTLFLREKSPGKLVIKTDKWSEDMNFPVHIGNFQDGNLHVLEVLESQSSDLFAEVVISLQPKSLSVAGVRAYEFIILDSDGCRTRWWVKEYLANKDAVAFHNEMMSYDEEEVLDLVDDMRTLTPAVDSVEVLPEEPKLPDPEFYLVSIEADANKIPEHPAWVVSYTPDGRSFTRSVNFPGGVGVSQDNYKMMVGILARMTPYSVEPGERLYKGALIMRNGKKIKIKVRQPIDQP